MKSLGQVLIKNPYLSGLYVLLIIIAFLQILLPAADPATLTKYHLTTGQLRWLSLSVELPYIAIWILSLIGYLRLKTYAARIQKDNDGVAFKTMARGLLWLNLWLPLSSVVGNAATEIYRYHPSATANLTRWEGYINLLILSVGFILVYRGSMRLLPIISRKHLSVSLTMVLSFITFSVLYSFMALHDPVRSTPNHTVLVATYYEPDWLIVLTTIIPRLLTWYLGLQAIYNLYLFSRKVKGLLYRQAVRQLTWGLAGVMAIVIALRCFQSLTTSLEAWGISALLGLVYILLILLCVSYVLVTKGAAELQKLEEA